MRGSTSGEAGGMRLSLHVYATIQSVQGPLVFVERIMQARMGEVVTIVFPDGREAEGEVVRILRQQHNLRPGDRNDFGIFKQDQILQEFHKIRLIATSVLAGIVSISLLVGGIGIMNVMLVSVTERTREIGLRKSVGAHRRDILLQFLTEAVVLSTVGGAIGIASGYAIVGAASMHPSMVETHVPLWSVMLALGFSAGVGIFFGLVPAFKAAIIHPIDALRHE